ncbi:hypothetical protein JCM8097_008194 [Rhodosporidiobolus ruineniae]
MLGLTGGCGGPQEDDQPTARYQAATRCVRCGQPAAISPNTNSTAWCQPCFHRNFASRFSKALVPARTVSAEGIAVLEGRKQERRRNDGTPPREPSKVVLAFSGGDSSRAVLELLKTSYYSHLDASAAPEPPTPAEQDESSTGKKKKSIKKHGLPRAPSFGECEVVYVDQSGVTGEPKRTDEIRRIVEDAAPSFRFTVLKLEDVYSSSSPSASLTASFSSPTIPLAPSSSSPSSSSTSNPLTALTAHLIPTARSSLLHSLLLPLLLRHARNTGAEVLLLGDSATRVAVNTLRGMSEGRGWSAGEEAAGWFVDRSAPSSPAKEGEEDDDAVLVVRPLALAFRKEVQFFNRTVRPDGRRLKSLDAPVETEVNGGGEAEKARAEKPKTQPVELKKKGIGGLVEDFITSLEVDFPSTVSTVVRTAHKLGMRGADASTRAYEADKERGEGKEGDVCVVCGFPADPSAHAWRAAITISDLAAARAALASSTSASASTSSADTASKPTVLGAVATAAANGVQRREPYKPSAAHLLPNADTASTSPSSSAPPATSSSAPSPPISASLATSSFSAPLAESDSPTSAANPSLSLAPYLCYGCLLVLQEPVAAASAAIARKPSAAAAAKTPAEWALPPYVVEAVEARRRRDERRAAAVQEESEGGREGGRSGVVGVKEVRGEEALRKEVGEFLLDEGDE